MNLVAVPPQGSRLVWTSDLLSSPNKALIPLLGHGFRILVLAGSSVFPVSFIYFSFSDNFYF